VILIACDRDGCPSQQRDDSTLDGWLVVHPMEDEGEHKQFCSADCMIQTYASFEVPEGVPSE
jgi:hypothetical protein